MIKKYPEATSSRPEQAMPPLRKPSMGVWLVALSGMVALVLCILFMAAPLQRLAGTPVSDLVPGGNLLVKAGFWLPKNLHVASDPYLNQLGTGNIEFLLLMALAFAVYGITALLIFLLSPKSELQGQRSILPLIWLGAIIGGLIFVFTSALLSHDVFVYAGYGRLIDVYHANPYFVPFWVYHHDPLVSLDDWQAYVSAYGPLWMAVCSMVAFVAGAQPLPYILLFRLIELAAHLVNIQLVIMILRKMERSPRVVTLGALLYAWNPLVLLESSQGGHNDIFMLTLILLGILLMVRSERRASTSALSAILPMLAFTLAALVKYTVIPLVVLAIFALMFRVLKADTTVPVDRSERGLQLVRRWKPALLTGAVASVSSLVVMLVSYGVFFAGHSFQAIVMSFTSPPSSQMAHKSVLDAIARTLMLNPNPPHTWFYALLMQLNSLKLWDIVNVVTLAGSILVGASWLWRTPTTRTFILTSLLTLGAFLLVAPWLLPWYATWLVALAVMSLPVARQPVARGLVAFALTFSLSIFILYLYNGAPPANAWDLSSVALTFGPPLLAFVIALLPWPQRQRSSIETT